MDFPKIFEKNADTRIVNGYDTGEPLPYQLQLVTLIELREFNVEEQYCGASLIAPDYAVSGQGRH